MDESVCVGPMRQIQVRSVSLQDTDRPCRKSGILMVQAVSQEGGGLPKPSVEWRWRMDRSPCWSAGACERW